MGRGGGEGKGGKNKHPLSNAVGAWRAPAGGSPNGSAARVPGRDTGGGSAGSWPPPRLTGVACYGWAQASSCAFMGGWRGQSRGTAGPLTPLSLLGAPRCHYPTPLAAQPFSHSKLLLLGGRRGTILLPKGKTKRLLLPFWIWEESIVENPRDPAWSQAPAGKTAWERSRLLSRL